MPISAAQQFFYLSAGIAIIVVAILLVVLLVLAIVFARRLLRLVSYFYETIDKMGEQVKDMGEGIKEKLESLSLVSMLAEAIATFRQLFKEGKSQKKK
jgi:predicted PurR-regulated permease PerM